MPYVNGKWVADYGGQYNEPTANPGAATFDPNMPDPWDMAGRTGNPRPGDVTDAADASSHDARAWDAGPHDAGDSSDSAHGGTQPAWAAPAQQQTYQAPQYLTNLQQSGASGLQSILSQDWGDYYNQQQQALFKPQEQAINTAADRQRQSMLEGTFGRGVGNSTITNELAGRLAQEQNDAIAKAQMAATTGASEQVRQNIASQLAASQGAFNAGVTGTQAGANIALSEAAQRAQQSQFGANLAYQLQQLAQQGSQFGQGLQFQSTENAANRAAAQALQLLQGQIQGGLLGQQQQFQAGESALNRQQQLTLADLQNKNALGILDAQGKQQLQQLQAQQGWSGNQADLNRQFQQLMLQQQQTYGAAQADKQAALQKELLQIQQQVGTTQTERGAQIQKELLQIQQGYGATQADLNRQQQTNLTQAQIDAANAARNQQMLYQGLGGGIGGLAALLGNIFGSQ